MFDVNSIGKALVIFGIVLALVGLVIIFGSKASWFGRLPGDIYIQKKNFSFYFPITTSILISVILSIAMLLFKRR
jgi:hypothetical protein